MKGSKLPPLTYFYYNGELHKKIHINRSSDVVAAFSYAQGKVLKYVYSDVRKNGEKAFTTREVGKMLGRTMKSIKGHIYDGNIRPPQMSYSMDENRNPFAYFWCEKDIMDALAFYQTVHRGRPRADGRVAPQALPTASELRAMIRQGTVLYVKNGDEFVPTWKAENF